MSSASKTSAATQAKPQSTQPGHAAVPHEKIAMRAYTKWQQRGCPVGSEQQDWHEAEAELRAEMTRGNSAPGATTTAGKARR